MKYTGENLKEISFPLGGIGTGSIGFAGNGRLMDFEIFNRPNKGSINGYTHFAIRAISKDGTVNARVLNGDRMKDLQGQYKNQLAHIGYGYGPESTTMCGFRHFRECEFEGEFPIANLYLADKDFPAKIKITAFNPLIPLNSKESSIPAAFFEIEVENISDEEMTFDCAFSVGNPFEISHNTAGEKDGFRYIQLINAGKEREDRDYGDLTVCCADKEATLQKYWYRGTWQDGIVTFWNEFSGGRDLIDRTYDSDGTYDMCSILSSRRITAHGKGQYRYVLAWNVPTNYITWNLSGAKLENDSTWKNYYASVFTDSSDAAVYSMKNYGRLYQETLAFHDELFSSTLDPAVIDAAASTLSVLKSPTVYRLQNGEFYGFEGSTEKVGSCPGTCQHVWNYAYALCFLFPDLARSIHDVEFKYSTSDYGKMTFRLTLPLGTEIDHKKTHEACVDGQMGTIIKLYREWKLSGNDEWLASHYEDMVKVLEYAWSEENTHEWDRDKDGVMEGRQHHTLDMELFGPSSWLQGFYLGALRAAAEIAEYLGHMDKAREYMELFEKGKVWTNENLFNGRYFYHKVDLKDHGITQYFNCDDRYWNEETEEIKYQLGDGCEIDQLCGQWHANICSLGRIFDEEKTKTALENLFKNNFKRSMRDFDNPWRIYALNDEPGAVICTYPDGKPSIPLPYCEESMNGFEYQMAGILISEGFVEEGLEVVRGVRSKYTGANRNPYNEMECGSNYARSMASYALIPIFSGFLFDLPHRKIGFNPVEKKDYFRSIWSVDGAWGNVVIDKNTFKCNIISGSLALRCMELPFMKTITEVRIDGKKTAFTFKGGLLCFDDALIKKGVEVCFEK